MSQRVWIAMIAASVGWGTGGVATRAALSEGVEPYALAALRALGAAVAVYIYLAIRGRRIPHSRGLWKVGSVLGTANLAGPFILFALAYQYASAGFVGLLAALIPIATAAFAHFMLPEEPLNVRKLGGLLVALIGVAILLLSGDSGLATGGRPLLAFTLSAAAVAMIGYGGAYAKRYAGRYEPVDIAGIHFLVGTAVISAAMVAVEGVPGGITGEGWALIGYLGTAGTFIPFVLLYWMLRYVSATQAALIGYLVPLIAVVAGVVFLSEQVQAGIALGGALILIGVVATDRTETRAVRVRV